MAIDGDWAVVGAPDALVSGIASGAAYVFQRQPNGTWPQVAKLEQLDPQTNDDFAWSVSISGTRVAAGAPLDDDGGATSGSAYVFDRLPDGTWPQAAKLLSSDLASADNLGYAVAVSGDRVVAGAWLDDDGGNGSGSAYIFERQLNGTWAQAAKLQHPDYLDLQQGGSHFGKAVAIDGDAALIGALDDIVGTKTFAGSANLYTRQPNGTWLHMRTHVNAVVNSNDNFGHSVSISGGRILCGASNDDDFGSNAGSARLVFDYATGAAGAEPLVFGSGSPGCSGTHTPGLNLPPEIGQSSFAFSCTSAPVSSLGLGMATDVADLAGSDPFGIGVLLHVDLLLSTEVVTFDFFSDPVGTGTAPAPLPNDPLLVGKGYHVQALWAWIGACSLPPYNLSTSKGLTLTILPS